MDKLDVSSLDAVKTAAARGWAVKCEERESDNFRYCRALRKEVEPESGSYVGFFINDGWGFAIMFAMPTREYEKGDRAAIGVGLQQMQAQVAEVICNGATCLHMMQPFGEPRDLVRALKTADKIKFLSKTSPEFNLSGSSAALSALLEAARATSIKLPDGIKP